jgi:hypothetical protein
VIEMGVSPKLLVSNTRHIPYVFTGIFDPVKDDKGKSFLDKISIRDFLIEEGVAYLTYNLIWRY